MLGDQLRGGLVHGVEVGEVELARRDLHPVPQLRRKLAEPVAVAVERGPSEVPSSASQTAKLGAQASGRAGDERLLEAPLGVAVAPGFAPQRARALGCRRAAETPSCLSYQGSTWSSSTLNP